MEKKKKKKKVFIHHPFERAYSPEYATKSNLPNIRATYSDSTNIIHVVYTLWTMKHRQRFSNSPENIKSKLPREQENTGWKRGRKNREGGEGEEGVEGRGAWRRQWVKQRDTRGDECACMRVHTCTCVHTWDSLLNKLTLKKWAADSLKGVARNHKSLEALL